MSLQWLVDKEIYAEYLRRLDARALLDHYGAENCSEVPNRDGSTEIIHSCLLDRVEPHHSHGDENPSAAFNVDKKVYCCYAGGWSGDAFHLIMKMEGVEAFADVLPTVSQFLVGAVVEEKALQEYLTHILTAPSAYTLSLPAYDDSVLSGFAHPHPYWNHRGITASAIERLKLGYDPKERRIVFPHFIDGTLVGWQKRVVPGETYPDFPKYRSSPGFPKAESLYGYDLLTDDKVALVVESPMSVAKAYSLGVKNTVATFGAKVTEGQLALLKPMHKVLVWFDADPAGQAGERRVLQGLDRHVEEVYRVTPTKDKDLGDIETLDEFCRYCALHTMPAYVRLAEYDVNRMFRR